MQNIMIDALVTVTNLQKIGVVVGESGGVYQIWINSMGTSVFRTEENLRKEKS